MSECTLNVNGIAIKAQIGDTLLDAALKAKVIIPQDCCTGQCNTCRVQVLEGEIEDNGTALNDRVLACCSILEGDASIRFEEVPTVVKRDGVISSLRLISPEIWEVVVSLDNPLDYFAGQYVGLTFTGFPSRDYSITPFEDGTIDKAALCFHIKAYEGGTISSAIGSKINLGHKVKVNGPFGDAFHREGEGRLVLIGAGTGWAPIWAIARESKILNPNREIAIVIGAGHAQNLYMGNSLLWLAEHGVSNISICATQSGFGGIVKKGRPTKYLPQLRSNDTVYACGLPQMVNSVAKWASQQGVTCYADPFTMSNKGLGLFDRVMQVIKLGASKTPQLASGNRYQATYQPLQPKRLLKPTTPSQLAPRHSAQERANTLRSSR